MQKRSKIWMFMVPGVLFVIRPFNVFLRSVLVSDL